MSSLTPLEELDISGRKVLVRVDLNAPVENGKVIDETRLVAVLPTLKFLLAKEASLILLAHRGRPKGEVVADLSLEPIASHLAGLLGAEVILADEVVGDGVKKLAAGMRSKQILMLENLRFEKGEKSNDVVFAKQLAALADHYVNDAFGVCHRAHASVDALPKLVAQTAAGVLVESPEETPRVVPKTAAGFLLKKEINFLGQLRDKPERPYVAVLGGSKVSDKVEVLEALLDRVDVLLIGGAMANTFLAAQGLSLDRSLVEKDKIATAQSILRRASARGVIVKLPSDLTCGESLDDQAPEVCGIAAVKGMALDIGPASIHSFVNEIAAARTLFWNGPMGVFEKPPYDSGTIAIAQAFAENKRALTVIGGGDSAYAARASGVTERIDHISTGGGAALEYIQGRKLPGIAALAT